MQRRTNLFYTTGDNSKFITFSNYTEALTGNFLATDWKMFPSKFMCLYIPELENNTVSKENFIKNIVSFYENKLAFLRDYYVNNNIKVDEHIFALDWLLHYIVSTYPQTILTYIGEVTEHNYNSVYADTICSIDGTIKPKTYTLNASTNKEYVEYDLDDKYLNYLYGWTDVNGNYTGTIEYQNVKPSFDDPINTKYLTTHNYTSITAASSSATTIKFNIIIPLFDLVNVNSDTNETIITENDTAVIEFNDKDNYINIPLGIWFADKSIVLDRDTATGYAPTWSLVLSSQFKPFPYSDKLQDEAGQTIADDAFVTFAQVLSRQNTLFTTFSKVTSDVQQLSTKIGEVEGKIGTLATTYTIDGIKRDLINYKSRIDNLIDINNDAAQTTVSELKESINQLETTVDELVNNMDETINITNNGIYNVSKYGTAIVNVSGSFSENGLQIGDVYTENVTIEKENANKKGKYRNIYFTLNANKESIWNNKDTAYICLYKYRGRRSNKNKNLITTKNISYNVSQHRFCLQNDSVVTDPNLTLYCWVSGSTTDSDTKEWKYYYTDVAVTNSVNIFPTEDTNRKIYVHRNTTTYTADFNQPLVAKNNYATVINNVVEYTGVIDTTSLIRHSEFDINNYVNVIQNVDASDKDDVQKKIKQIIDRSSVNRNNRYNYNCYADDFRITPELISNCKVLILTKDVVNKSGKQLKIGDMIALNELTEEQFLDDAKFPKVILVLPWNTYYIIMRYFKNDYCDLYDRGTLINNLRTRCKGGSSQKIKEHPTLPLQFGICTEKDIINGNRATNVLLSKKLYWGDEIVTVGETTTTYIGIQHIK